MSLKLQSGEFIKFYKSLKDSDVQNYNKKLVLPNIYNYS